MPASPNHMEPEMPKLLCCRGCRIELERITLADGSAVLLCVPCDTVGIEHEVLLGGPMWVAQMTTVTVRNTRRRPAR